MGSSQGRTPRSTAELWRWMVAELDKLRRRSFLDTGDWVVEQDDSGNLTATYTPTGRVVVIASRPAD